MITVIIIATIEAMIKETITAVIIVMTTAMIAVIRRRLGK
jgi:hypothetical protein